MTENVVPFRALRKVREPTPFKMAKHGKVAEVFIYDSIGAGFFEDGITAKTFSADLKRLEPFDTLNIFINSPGGSVFEGIAIHNIIARQKARKVVRVDGLAASIASVIAMAGDEIEIAANGLFMIHNPWTIAMGDSNDMRKTADTLDTIRGTILNTYVDRAGADDPAEFSAMMDAETWLNAEEAAELGLADTVVESVDLAAMAGFDFSEFKNTPRDLQPDAESASTDETTDDGELESAFVPVPHPALAKVNARVAKLHVGEGQPSDE